MLCLTERDYWKPTGSVLISVPGQKEPIPYTIGGEKSQLENIETPTLIRFTSADGRKMLIDPEKIENDLRDLFEFFYVSHLQQTTGQAEKSDLTKVNSYVSVSPPYVNNCATSADTKFGTSYLLFVFLYMSDLVL